jgi:hypothetical protein
MNTTILWGSVHDLYLQNKALKLHFALIHLMMLQYKRLLFIGEL